MARTVSVPGEMDDLFVRAEQLVESYFARKREVPERGHIDIAGNRYVLVRAQALSVEFYDTMTALYQGQQTRAFAVGKNLLFHLAHSIGISDARAFHAQLGLEDPVAKLSAGPVHFAHTGWASVEIHPESKPVPSEEFVLVYDHPFSFESDSWRTAGRTAPGTACFMNAGYSSGWCQESFGLPLVATEILCSARGDRCCRFIMAPPDHIEEHVARYLEAHPDDATHVRDYVIPGEFEHRSLEQQLKRSEGRYQQLFETATDAILLIENRRIDHANRRATELFGLSRDEMCGRSLDQLSPPTQPGGEVSASDIVARIDRAAGGDPQVFVWCFERRGEEDSRRPRQIHTELSLTRSPEGPGILLAIIRDLTERERLEGEIRQLQKMEAIGRLAGGVAHDFNNLLTGLFGNIDLAMMRLRPGDPVAEQLEELQTITQRAADLTRQLLAFGRKQVMEPRRVDLNELIVGMHKMLARIIGEDVTLRTVPADGLGTVKVDPGQIEQIIVNLAINGRDAMPEGGALTIETANVTLDDGYCAGHPEAHPGAHVRLAVSDRGHGMDPETRRRVFEPFFTTKGVNQGTGLGLSTVYGIVKQHGGSIDLLSELGRGTTVEIYLPRQREAPAPLPQRAADPTVPGGIETILLVEDEASVRATSADCLRRLGYTVLVASRGDEALRLAGDHPRDIDLLLTDVVMPDMNGRELAREFGERSPSTRVLFTSGYTDDVIAQHGVLEEGVQFLAKPYTPPVLAREVRRVLDRPPDGS
jgi:PAS domain S-box-containing protein